MSFKQKLLSRYKRLKFRDRLRIYVKAGSGGQGFPKYGGVGGRGGNVIVEGDEEMTLNKLADMSKTTKFKAGVGGSSSRRAILGTPGQDLVIGVPPGTSISLDNGVVVGEINVHGEQLLVAKGGLGEGPKSPKTEGHKLHLCLDLKLIADVGLVGFPNAGKSSLLKALSRAKPKIAGYPFTTLKPNLGVIDYRDKRQVTVADLPGLIEGAHINVGMGHSFLKHTERTKLLLFMVDVHGFRLSNTVKARSGLETILLLMKELELFKEELVSKPALLALNKIDIEGGQRKAEELTEKVTHLKECLNEVESDVQPSKLIRFEDILQISAKEGTNVDHLKDRVRDILDHHEEESKQRDLVEMQEHSAANIRQKLKEHHARTLV